MNTAFLKCVDFTCVCVTGMWVVLVAIWESGAEFLGCVFEFNAHVRALMLKIEDNGCDKNLLSLPKTIDVSVDECP